MTSVRSFTQKHAQVGTILLSLLLSILIVSCSRENPTGTGSHTPPYFCSDSSSLSTSLRALTLYSDSLCVQSDNEDSLTYSFLDSVDGITISDAVISWTPMENDTGRKTISLRVSDGQGGSDTVRWIITVFPANHSPVFDSSIHLMDTTFTDKNFSAMIHATDADGDSLVYALIQGPAAMKINGNVLSWTPEDSDIGYYMISVQVSDGWGGQESMAFHLRVMQSNRPPRFVDPWKDSSVSAFINVLFRDTLRALDPDNDSVRFSILNPISGLTLKDSILSWTPDVPDIGTKTLLFCAGDGRGGLDTLRMKITISSTVPVFLSRAQDMKASATIGSQYLDTLTYLSSAGVNFSFIDSVPGMTLNQDIIQWTPTRSDTGTHTITVVLGSSGKGCDTLRWIIKIDALSIPVDSSDTTTVVPENNPPVFISTPASMQDTGYLGVPYEDTIAATDPDDDPLTYTILSGFNDMIMSDNAIVWTPQISDTGITKEIRIEVSDGNGGSDTLHWNVQVLASQPDEGLGKKIVRKILSMFR
jgi:hypothetical protein